MASDRSEQEGNKEYKDMYHIARNGDPFLRVAAYNFGGGGKDTPGGKGYRQGRADRLEYGPQDDGLDIPSIGEFFFGSSDSTSAKQSNGSASGPAAYSGGGYVFGSDRGSGVGSFIWGGIAFVAYIVFCVWFNFPLGFGSGPSRLEMGFETSGEFWVFVLTIPGMLVFAALFLAFLLVSLVLSILWGIVTLIF